MFTHSRPSGKVINSVGTPRRSRPDNYYNNGCCLKALWGLLLSVAYLINPLKKPVRQVLLPAEGTKVD